MADNEKKSTSGTSGTPVSLPRRTEKKTSVATADAKSTNLPENRYPDGSDKDTGLGESGIQKPGDPVTRTERHQARADAASSDK